LTIPTWKPSTDGKQWETLPGQSTTNDDPNGANFSDGYTAKSGVPATDKKSAAKWIQEQIDLSKYAGQKVQIRFEYVTDAGVTHAGFFVDDIAIPEINYRYDGRVRRRRLQARGFIRHANLAEQWLVQLITVAQKSNNRGERCRLPKIRPDGETINLSSDVTAVAY